jgi:hypothetical protein
MSSFHISQHTCHSPHQEDTHIPRKIHIQYLMKYAYHKIEKRLHVRKVGNFSAFVNLRKDYM